MSRSWTPAQQAAIEARGGHLLVSAAAGSGKTAVLVERVIRLITLDGIDIDRLLVVTFTEAAAGEMRDRVMQALEQRLAANPHSGHLLRQLMLLPKASIATLHAFCLQVLRQHFYRLDLDPEFRVMDEHEAQLLRLDVLDGVLEQAYDQTDPDGPFTRLVLAYGGPSGDGDLRQFILDLHDYARSLPDPAGWLRRCARGYRELTVADFDETPWARELVQLTQVRVRRAARLVRQALALALGPGGVPAHADALERDLERLARLEAAAAQGWSVLAAAAHEAGFPRLPRAKAGEGDPAVREAVRRLRDEAKKAVGEPITSLLARPLSEQLAELRDAAPLMEALIDQVLALDQAYAAAKRERGWVDFGDLEHLCLRLLEDPEAAQQLRERFAEVLVDESQDLNGVQEAILGRVCGSPEDGGRLFLVGDVKQSIYRFRQADPTLFLERYRRAAPYGPPAAGDTGHTGQRRIDLQANFRSRAPVVDGVNFIFRQIMTPAAGELAYDAAAELVCGAPYGPGGTEAPIEVHLLERDPALLEEARGAAAPDDAAALEAAAAADTAGAAGTRGATAVSSASELGATETQGASQPLAPEDAGETDESEDLTALEREAVLAARRIRALVLGGEAQVWDNSLGTYRPARWGDVAVLLRATRHKANAVLDVLARFGVPAYAELGTGYFAALEVETMLALLAVLDNPRQDIPLAAVLRSPLAGFSPADLARIRAVRREGDFWDAVRAAAEEGELGALGRRLQGFLVRLEQWRTRARRGPLSELVWSILTETGYFDYVGAMPGGRQRQANLRALYERARQFDTFAKPGLARFLRFIERLQEAAGDLGTAPAVGESDDVVRVMSVHKSKGLEFPIVVVLDLGRPFRQRPGHRHLAFQRELGLGAAVVDGERRVAWPSLLSTAVQERRRREELAEEMRVLYVALTRARERLILIGSGRNLERLCGRWAQAAGQPGWALDDAELLDASNWLDWLGPALSRHAAGAPLRELGGFTGKPADAQLARDPSRWRVRVWRAPDVIGLGTAPGGEEATPVHWSTVAALEPLEGMEDVRVPDALADRIAWRYPWTALTGLAAKQSVSELKRRWTAAGQEESAPAISPGLRLRDRPRFLHAGGRALTPAERGIAVHTVLQRLELDAGLDEDGIRSQIEEMTARGLLTPQQAQAVDPGQLARFFASPLGRRVQAHARQVLREVPFTLALPAAEVYPELDPAVAADEHVVVQGVIDLLLPYETGLILVDFKTDRVAQDAAQQAAGRYTVQIGLYCRAVREIYGRDVTEAYVVFLTAGQVVSMPTR